MMHVISYPRAQSPALTKTEWQIWLPEESDPDVPQGKQMIPFAHWVLHSKDSGLIERALAGEIGVWFATTDDVLQYKQLIHAGQKFWPIVAVHFPIFRDGRGYSTAALLRERLAWSGPIWAIGDILVDQLVQLARVGFDHFVLRNDQDCQLALTQFEQFSVRMQDSWRYSRTLTRTIEAVTA
jgi:uncharacterized protein (DUF934 family)